LALVVGDLTYEGVERLPSGRYRAIGLEPEHASRTFDHPGIASVWRGACLTYYGATDGALRQQHSLLPLIEGNRLPVEVAHPAAPYVMYRLYDADRILLYIGITANLRSRLLQHRRTQAWWGRCATVDVTSLPNKFVARYAEDATMKIEAPLYNKTCNTLIEDLVSWREKEIVDTTMGQLE